MASNFLNLVIDKYLRSSKKSGLSSNEYRAALHEATPPLLPKTKTELLHKLPSQVGVSFVRLADSIGARPVGARVLNEVVEWAKRTTTLLSRITAVDQDATVIKYGRIPSQIVNPHKIVEGCMYTYRYDAETTNDFDRYPMMLCLSRNQTSILGMNFHYLPYSYRFDLFEAMMPLIFPIPASQLSKIYITYKTLSSSRQFIGYGATIKRYNIKAFDSNAVFIAPVEWGVALAYPSSQFSGKTLNTVWQESVRKHVL